MTQTATIKWTDPAAAIFGGQAFSGVEVAMQVEGAPSFTVIGTVAPGGQTDTIPDLADGDYSFRLTALFGTKRATGVVLTGEVASGPAPDVTGASVTFA